MSRLPTRKRKMGVYRNWQCEKNSCMQMSLTSFAKSSRNVCVCIREKGMSRTSLNHIDNSLWVFARNKNCNERCLDKNSRLEWSAISGRCAVAKMQMTDEVMPIDKRSVEWRFFFLNLTIRKTARRTRENLHRTSNAAANRHTWRSVVKVQQIVL